MKQERKRILDVAPFGVVPPIHGGSLRIFNICQYLSHCYSIMLFSQGIRSNEFQFTTKSWTTEVNLNFSEHRHVNIPASLGLELCRRVGIPSSIFVGDVLNIFKPRVLNCAINEVDCIQVEHPWQFEYVFKRKKERTPIVLVEHNYEYDLLQQIIVRNKINRKLLETALELEQFAVENADLVITVSDIDKNSLCQSFDISKGKIITVPNGVDSTRNRPISRIENEKYKKKLGLSGKYVILFTGSAYPPNIEAVKKICTVIAPNCAAEDIIFLIVGKVGEKLRSAKNILFTGSVVSVDDYVKCADIAINPMISGSGTNLKMLEYFSYGLPVISTERGARGLDLDGNHVIISRIDDFPENITRLRESPELYLRLQKNVRTLAEERYDWKVIGSQMAKIYENLLI